MARPSWMQGREIKDATKGVTINIRQKHIDDAVALNGEHCVAGRCTLQALDAAYVWFYRTAAYVAWDDDDSPILRYANSGKLIKDVIEVLDDPKRSVTEIPPGLYDLLPPSPARRLGKQQDNRTGRKRGKIAKNRGRRVLGRVSAAKHV